MTEEDLEPRTDREEMDIGVSIFEIILCKWPNMAESKNILLMPRAKWNQNRQCEDSMHISDKASLYPGDSGQQFNILESKFKTHLGHWYLNAYLNFPTFVSDCDFYKLLMLT